MSKVLVTAYIFKSLLPSGYKFIRFISAVALFIHKHNPAYKNNIASLCKKERKCLVKSTIQPLFVRTTKGLNIFIPKFQGQKYCKKSIGKKGNHTNLTLHLMVNILLNCFHFQTSYEDEYVKIKFVKLVTPLELSSYLHILFVRCFYIQLYNI